jgi:uncharacterized protein
MRIAMATQPHTLAPGAVAGAGRPRLSLFGSMAHGEARPESDVDRLIEVDSAARFGWSDRLDLQDELGDRLGCPIGFAFASEMLPWPRDWIEDDRIGI